MCCARNEISGELLILLADDDTLIRKYVKKILCDAGYSVVIAANGQEAVSLFYTTEGINLLILDIMMPKKNGWDAYKEISGQNHEIPAIFISGYDESFIDVDYNKNSFIKYIPKPFNQQTILDAIMEAVSQNSI